jgi:hypothetical protein
MRTIATAAVAASTILWSPIAFSEADSSEPLEASLSPEQIVAMQATFPNEGAAPLGKAAGFDKLRGSRKVAIIIAQGARSRLEAALAAVYAAYEGGNQAQAKGDRDASGEFHSFGVFQLSSKHTDPALAFDTRRAFRVWQAMKDRVEEQCGSNEPEERLAALISGDCRLARAQARKRYEVAERAMQAVFADDRPSD